jgi:hypothetical protein
MKFSEGVQCFGLLVMPTENKRPYFDRVDLLILQLAFDIMREREVEADDKQLLRMAKELVKAFKPIAPAHSVNETARLLVKSSQSRIQ